MTSSGPSTCRQPDDLDVGELVVEREGRARLRRRRARQREIGRRDIDAREHLHAVLQPAHVDGDRREQDHAEHQSARAAAQPELHQRALNDEHDDGAQHALHHGAATAAEADAAEHRGRQRRDFQPRAGVGPGRVQPRRVEHARRRGQHARDDIGEADRAPHRDAGVMRRAARAADRLDMPAEPQPRQEDMGGDGDDDGDQEAAREIPQRAVAHEIPGGGVLRRIGDEDLIFEDQRVDDRPHDDERDQRRQKGAEPQIADQQAVDEADQRPRRQTRAGSRRAPASRAR